MAKIKYTVKENKKLGTHSFYAVPVVNGSLTFDEVVEEACRNTSLEPSFVKAAVTEYMKAVKSNILKGFRVPVGESFLFVYPNIRASVKDYEDENHQLVVATAEMVSARKAESRLGCTVAPKFSAEFAANVSWQRTDAQGSAVDEPEDDVTEPSGGNGGGGDLGGDLGE